MKIATQEQRLRDLRRDRQIRREQQHGAEHDRREDRPALRAFSATRELADPGASRSRAPGGSWAGRPPGRARCPRRRPRRSRGAAPSRGADAASSWPSRDYARLLQAILPPAITVCDDGTAEVVREVTPVLGRHEHDVRVEPGCKSSLPVGAAEHVRRVHGARRERFLGREPHLRRRERAHEREALAEGAARVEVRRERDCGAGVDERASGRHRAVRGRARSPEAGRPSRRSPRAPRSRSLPSPRGGRPTARRARRRGGSRPTR